MLHKPKRVFPRIERDEVIEVMEDENAHLWAVSYADFLMALLSFFILFYSVDEPQRDKLIMNLTADLASVNSAGGNGAGPGGGGAVKVEHEESVPARMPANFLALLKGLDVKIDQEKEYLVVNFPNDMYTNGTYKLAVDNRELLSKFLAILKPYDGAFNLYFEGHTDTSPLVHHRNSVITDNFVLSSLRASSALQMARENGFNEKFLFTQANSSNVRNSRSLSVRLERRKDNL